MVPDSVELTSKEEAQSLKDYLERLTDKRFEGRMVPNVS
jgi:hypothetical protein